MATPIQVAGDGLIGSLAQAAVIAGTLVLLMMLVALGTFAYRNLRGDGVEWPDDREDPESGVQRGDDDDEWDYY